MSLDGSNVVYATGFVKIHETGNTSLTDTIDTKVATAGGGLSQTDFDSSIATLTSKNIAYNNTITSHISLIDTNTTDIATHTNDIAGLNTKQIQNFSGINDINTNLTNNYQTNSQLATNFYNKTEIDTTLGNYYTMAVADTVFYSQTSIHTKLYTRTEVDGLVGARGGYSDTRIDNFLNLQEEKSAFTDNVSFFPVIDLSRPSIIHQGVTLKHSVVNVEPLEGLLFSNQFGAEVDRVISVFKNSN